MRKLLLTLSFAVLGYAPAWAAHEGSGQAVPPGPGFRGGVVAVSHPLAAAAGARMLRSGGNAIDAAAAIQFALNVVEPEFSGIGGGGFMMVHLAKGQGSTFPVEGREKAPASADTTLFTNPDGTNQGFTPASTSGQAVGVTGTLKIVATALQRYGRKHLAEVIQPAIELAENGFTVNFVLAGDATSSRTSFYAETAAVFRPGGVPLQQGQILKQPDLAKTLRLIAAKGPDVLYRGEIGAAIVAAQRATANGGKPGLMTMQDLADYNIVIREPIVAEYRGYRIAAMSPPSSGGLTMIQALKMIERYPLGDASAGFGFGRAQTLHVMTEAMRLAFADRAAWMGDEDFVPVPKRGLLDPTYVRERGDLISLTSIISGTAPRDDPLQGTRAGRRLRLAGRRDHHQLGLQRAHQPGRSRHDDPAGGRRAAHLGDHGRQLDRARGRVRRGRDRQAARAGAQRRQPRRYRQRQRDLHRPRDRPPVRRGRLDARRRPDRTAEGPPWERRRLTGRTEMSGSTS